MPNTFTGGQGGGSLYSRTMRKIGEDFRSLGYDSVFDRYKGMLAPVFSYGLQTKEFGDRATQVASAAQSEFQPQFSSAGQMSGQFNPVQSEDWAGWLQQLAPQSNFGQQSTFRPTASYQGSYAAAGPSPYAALGTHNNEINQIAQKYGLPPNMLKTVINRESSGNWEASQWVANVDGTQLLPFVGMKREAAESVGMDFRSLVGNKLLQIEAMARILRRDMDAYGSPEAALSNYLTGNPQGYLTGATDSNGMRADYYVGEAMNLWRELDGSAVPSSSYAQQYGQNNAGTSTGYSQATYNLQTIWGGGDAPVTFDFNAGGGPDLYGYGSQYGMNGTGHTGIDVGLALGSPLYSPGAGVVTCAGTGVGPGADGGGCSAFNDVMGQGAGRIEIQLDSGDVIILGHSSTANVRPGQRVNAGDMVGTSGGMNGAHSHIEARRRDPSTGSGWRIIDPRQVLGGQFGGTYGQSGPQVNQPVQQQPGGLFTKIWQPFSYSKYSAKNIFGY